MRPSATTTRSAASSDPPRSTSASAVRDRSRTPATRAPSPGPRIRPGDVGPLMDPHVREHGDPAADAPVDQVAGGGEQPEFAGKPDVPAVGAHPGDILGRSPAARRRPAPTPRSGPGGTAPWLRGRVPAGRARAGPAAAVIFRSRLHWLIRESGSLGRGCNWVLTRSLFRSGLHCPAFGSEPDFTKGLIAQSQ